MLVCSTSVTVTSPSWFCCDSLRLEVFLTFLVLRSVVVNWTCTSTSAMAMDWHYSISLGLSVFSITGRGRDPNSNASTGGWIAGIIPECLASTIASVEGVWDLNLEEWRRGQVRGRFRAKRPENHAFPRPIRGAGPTRPASEYPGCPTHHSRPLMMKPVLYIWILQTVRLSFGRDSSNTRLLLANNDLCLILDPICTIKFRVIVTQCFQFQLMYLQKLTQY